MLQEDPPRRWQRVGWLAGWLRSPELPGPLERSPGGEAATQRKPHGEMLDLRVFRTAGTSYLNSLSTPFLEGRDCSPRAMMLVWQLFPERKDSTFGAWGLTGLGILSQNGFWLSSQDQSNSGHPYF